MKKHLPVCLISAFFLFTIEAVYYESLLWERYRSVVVLVRTFGVSLHNFNLVTTDNKIKVFQISLMHDRTCALERGSLLASVSNVSDIDQLSTIERVSHRTTKNYSTVTQVILNTIWLQMALAYVLIHLSVYWFRPLWLLKIDKWLTDLSFHLPLFNTEISARWFVFSRYYPRVLDAWVKAHLPAVKENFNQKETVRERSIYIPIPVSINSSSVQHLSGEDLQHLLKRNLLIVGEGGIGKTTLACQIAKWAMSNLAQEQVASHPMLPVLIEHELIEKNDSNNPLIETIQGQLEDLTNGSEPIKAELLTELLRQRRLLLIVDGFSEMTEGTQRQVCPELPGFSSNALIVTSRDDQVLNQVSKTVIQPNRISGTNITTFVEAYFVQLKKQAIFTQAEFVGACERLLNLVGDRNITPLLARLYVDELVAAKSNKRNGTTTIRPNNIPDLMLCYLNEINHGIRDNKLDDRVMHADAERIAWECLKFTYSPSFANRDTVLAALGGQDAASRLDYFEHRLHLIKTISPSGDKIQFCIDPLAEYLAGLYLVKHYGSDQSAWCQLLSDLTRKLTVLQPITNFLLVMKDCCCLKGRDAHIPDLVMSELTVLVQKYAH